MLHILALANLHLIAALFIFLLCLSSVHFIMRAWRPLRLVLCVIAGALMAPTFALAQAAVAAPPDTLFHIPQPMWDEINALVLGLVIALATLAFKWIDSHSPLKNTQADAILRDAFTTLLNNAARYGLSQAQSAEQKVGDIDVGNAAVAAGANMLIAQGPQLAAKMGFDVTTPEGRAAIIRSVTLRVADLQSAPGEAPKQLTLPPAVAATGTISPPSTQPPPPPPPGKVEKSG